jgi:uncharacterized protein (TIGR02646 family)
MKYIAKGQEPATFTRWKNLRNSDWTPTYEALRGNEKRVVMEALKKEQGHLCCYCERRLELNDSHIEHLKPQGENLFPENQLDYDNLLCSCQREVERGEPIHCGNSKGSWYNDHLLISPLSADCEAKFKYTFDGYIKPATDDDVAASKTIDKLKLNIDKINTLRRKAIEPFIDEELTETDLNNFTRRYLIDKAENEGKFNEFFTTIKYLFDN